MKEFLIRLIFGGRDSAFFAEVSGYWSAYGGLKAILRSRWFITSVFLAIVFEPFWKTNSWSNTALSFLPSLLGFSIGAMAIVFAFPTSAIFRFIAEDGRPDSYYIQISAKFVHFVIVQIFAIILAFAAASYHSFLLNAVGMVALLYALATGGATAFALFGVAQLYNASASVPERPPNDNFDKKDT